MRHLADMLETLKTLKYLQAQISVSNNNLRNIELLSNGKKFAENLKHFWRAAEGGANVATKINDAEKIQSKNKKDKGASRFAFVKEADFEQQLRLLKSLPAITKNQYLGEADSGLMADSRLITDYFFHSSCGLSKFYNIQRERKIWWMRYSANPSRYFLEPYNDEQLEDYPNAQSITIKARFPFGNVNVEHISLVELNEAPFLNHIKADLQIFDSTGQKQIPSVIRSVIDVKPAISGLLLDACDHKRERTLLLNRKLAPYQCTIACLYKDDSLSDLRDLYKHLSNCIMSAGLRVLVDRHCFEPYEIFSSDYKQINKSLQRADGLGIPYSLLIDETTLENGILKLRSRDTTLKETIHISDIPKYLMQIFKN